MDWNLQRQQDKARLVLEYSCDDSANKNTCNDAIAKYHKDCKAASNTEEQCNAWFDAVLKAHCGKVKVPEVCNRLKSTVAPIPKKVQTVAPVTVPIITEPATFAPETTTAGSSSTLLILGAIGGVVVLLIVCAIVFLMCKKKKKGAEPIESGGKTSGTESASGKSKMSKMGQKTNRSQLKTAHNF